MPKAQKIERPDAAGGRTKEARAAAVAKWMDKLSSNFDPEPRYLIPILQFIQADAGYLPPEAMQAAAAFLKIPDSRVFGVASFYAQFRFEPQGKYTMTVCRGTACHVRGSGPLLKDLSRHLGVEAGETTDDMLFTLQTVSCFGSCALAPVVVVGDRVYGRQTADSMKRIVNELSAQGKKGGRKKGRPKKAARKKKRASMARSKKTKSTARSRS